MDLSEPFAPSGLMGPALNRNHARRDEILGTAGARYSGGIKHFTGLDAARLQQLVDERFLDPQARQNRSPTAEQFLRFLRRWPWVTAHGYAVSRRREDYRVSLEGLACALDGVPPERREQLREEFRQLCGEADEYLDEGNRLWAWWD
jgi:hypothetical protein